MEMKDLLITARDAFSFLGIAFLIAVVFFCAFVSVIFFRKVWEHVNTPHTEKHIEKWVDKEFVNCTLYENDVIPNKEDMPK